MQLFRPIGLTELDRILKLDARAFPPRLSWQPIFYPVLNAEYARQIARDWNTPDEFSSYAGFVTEFEVEDEYVRKFEVMNVGGHQHNELWVPSEELAEFNAHIIGYIRVIESFYGPAYTGKVESTLLFAGMDALTQWKTILAWPEGLVSEGLKDERLAVQANFAFWNKQFPGHPLLMLVRKAFETHWPGNELLA